MWVEVVLVVGWVVFVQGYRRQSKGRSLLRKWEGKGRNVYDLGIRRIRVGCSGRVVIGGVSIAVTPRGVAAVVKPGNYKGSALLGTVSHVLAYSDNSVLLSNISVFAVSAGQLTGQVTVLLRHRRGLSNVAIRRVISCNEFPRQGNLEKLNDRSGRVVS